MTRIPHLFKLIAALCLALAGLVTAPAAPAGAVPTDRYVATTGDDTSNDCSNAGSPCQTVGHAITQSTAGDTIYIAAGTYVENLDIGISLTLVGDGMDVTMIDGGGASRVVTVPVGASVGLSSMTIQNGDIGTSNGGGISNDGTLSVDHVRVTGNSAGAGAGIYSWGPLTISDSDISWNIASDAGSGAGGGLYLTGAVTTTLIRTSVRYNSAEVYSGGIHLQGGGTLNLTNVTVQGNSTTDGTAAMTVTALSTASILNSTISGNTSDDLFANAIAGHATLNFKNTIVSANTPANCNIGGGSTWTSLGNNIDSGNTCGFANAGDQINTNPLLEQSGNYGGSVPTMTLQAASPAIDAGNNTGCPATDARGFPRPIDGDNDATATCDIGAVEMKQQQTQFGVYGLAPYPADVGQTVVASATVTGSLTTPTGTVEVTSTGTSCNITLSGGTGNCNLVFSTPGPHGVLYRYTGDGTHDASQAALLMLVKVKQETVGIHADNTFYLRNANAPGPADYTFSFGWAGPIPLIGDWDGDGVATIGIDDGGWFFLRNANSAGAADLIYQYGWAGATPLMGDWNGDGYDTPGLYSDGWFFLRNDNSPGPADLTFSFGWAGPTPLVGDWNGDGVDTVGIHTGDTFFLRNSNSAGPADLTFSYGWAGATPVVGDWDGDDMTTIGITGGGTFYLRNSNSAGAADATFGFGWGGATPLAGTWDYIP